MAFSTSNGAAGEGGIFVLSGTMSAAAPLIVANFKPTGGKTGPGPDGPGTNVYKVCNLSTDTSYIACVCVNGLHGTSETSNQYAGITAGGSESFQIGERANNLRYVTAHLRTATGVEAASGSIYLMAFNVARRES